MDWFVNRPSGAGAFWPYRFYAVTNQGMVLMHLLVHKVLSTRCPKGGIEKGLSRS